MDPRRPGVVLVGLLASLLAAALHAAAGAGPAAAAAGRFGQVVPAEELAERIAAGETVEESGITVAGSLDLRPLQSVSRPIRCLNCVFQGSLLASDVIFQRVVDLSGALVQGSLDFRGAVFQDAFLLRPSEDQGAVVEGTSRFALAAFVGRAGLDGATFGEGADFTGSRFLSDASFAEADFGGPGVSALATFDLVSFGGSVLFSGSTERGRFWGDSSFSRTAFEEGADFRQRAFQGNATFEGATFQGPLDFTLASFTRGALFDRASFRGTASFVAATFSQDASFRFVAVSRSLDFFGAQFFGDASFFGMSAAVPVSLDRILMNGQLDMSRVAVDDLTMELEIVPKIGGVVVQENVLRLIEESARDRGDLSVANRARFELLSLQNDQSGGLKRWLDWFFYRTIAGYLVRPAHPLVAFLLLLAVGTLVRTGSRWRELWPARQGNPAGSTAAAEGKTGARAATRVRRVKMAASLFKGLADTASVAFRPKPGIGLEDSERISSYGVAAVRWVEFLGFKVLIALFLFGLANSNATLRDLVDAVRG